jgi:homogentisate 1,2-dioxygenase
MDTVPKMIPPTVNRRQFHRDFRDELENWHSSGRPPKGFYSYKHDFGAEILRKSPPTVIGDTETFADRSDFRATIAEHAPRRTGALRRRAIDMSSVQGDDFSPVLWSDDCSVWAFNGKLGTDGRRAWRHGDAHELMFIHRAEENFDISTDFGVLENVGQGDFVYFPRGTTYAFPETEEVSILMYEFPSPLMRPYDYWMGDQQPWPYPKDAPRGPVPKGADPLFEDDPVREVVLKHREADWTSLHYETPVFDCYAWEAERRPFALNLEDVTILASPDFHVDPPKVSVFVSEGEGMYLQTFLPRWMQSPPYNHINQVDEALFNHSGYEARPEVSDGFMTLHPSGLPHGPDPRVVEELANTDPPEGPEIPWSSEIGVMVESVTPFSVLQPGQDAELDDYHESWKKVAEDEGLVE